MSVIKIGHRRAASLMGALLAILMAFGVIIVAPPAGASAAVRTTATYRLTADEGNSVAAYLSSPQGVARVEGAYGFGSLTRVSASQGGRDGRRSFQAGRDGDHYWLKVTVGEIAASGAAALCRWAFGAVSWLVCPAISYAVQQVVNRNPYVNGVWAAFYIGRVQVGTW